MSSTTDNLTLDALRDTATDLPTIPETLTRILRLLEDPNSGARDLAEVIRGDAPLAAKILRLANSPLYQKSRSIATVQECVAVLGYRTVRQVALCVAVVSSLGRECDEQGASLDYRDLWRHSVATGAVARVLAERSGHPDPELALVCGLLHDLGKFVLAIREPRRYQDVVTTCRRAGLPLVDLERRMLGFDHAQAGVTLAEAWRFPTEVVDAIGSHHGDPAPGTVAALVALADTLASDLEPSASDLGFQSDLVDVALLCRRVGLEPDDIDASRDDLAAAIAAVMPLANLD